MSSGQVAIWTLSGAMISTAAALFAAGAGDVPPIISSVHVPFWALLVAFAAAERFVVHVHFRRSAHSMSLGEIPLVFALVFAGGSAAILAGALGRLAVLALHRKLPVIRLAFNFGVFLLGNCVAVLVFHAIAGGAGEIGPAVWAAAILGTVASSLIAVLLISAAVSLSEAQLSIRQVARSLRTDLTVVVANTSVGLCAATILYEDRKAAILMAIPSPGCSSASGRTSPSANGTSGWSSSTGRRESCPVRRRSARRSRDCWRRPSTRSGPRSRRSSSSRRTATMRCAPPCGPRARPRFSRPSNPRSPRASESLIEGHDRGACAASEIGDERLLDYLRARELGDGMLAVLKGERSLIGAITIGNPSGVVDHFCADDVKLLETAGEQHERRLENDRLGQTVWRLKELQRELEHQASHDPLTDLANRSLFVERVGDALRSARGGVSVIFIDIDDFKTVNDSLGHAAGDELLIAVARRLHDCVRPSDTVARLGGDEFAIMLDRPNSQQEAIEVTERINRHLAERFSIGGQNISVHASAGIATAARGIR